MEIQNPTNLAVGEGKTQENGVSTSPRPLQGFKVRYSDIDGSRLDSSGSASSSEHMRIASQISEPKQTRQTPFHSEIRNELSSTPCPPVFGTRQRQSPFSSRPVTLVVGPGQPSHGTPRALSLVAHESLLTEISPFFRAALQKSHVDPQISYSFSEAHSGVIKLPDEQPEDIDFLLQWAYWRTLLVLARQQPHRPETHLNGCPQGNLYHHSINPHVHKYKKWQDQKKLLKQTFGPFSNEVRTFKKQRKRPKPPSFGPLIRLYIIADKYDVQKGLREEIVLRVREVSKQANCVPDADDIALLYDNVVEDAASGLTKEVLELYADLDFKSMRNILASDSVDIAAADDDGGGQVNKWHSRFIKDLLLAVVRRRQSPGSEC